MWSRLIQKGTIASGGTLTTVNPHYTTEEVQNQLNDSDASIVFATEDDLGMPLALFSLVMCVGLSSELIYPYLQRR